MIIVGKNWGWNILQSYLFQMSKFCTVDWSVSGFWNKQTAPKVRATYLLLLLLQQPISKLDTHALSLTPWVLDYIEFFRFQTENYCYCSYYLCNELSVTSKSPSVFGDKIFLIVIFIAFGINWFRFYLEISTWSIQDIHDTWQYNLV